VAWSSSAASRDLRERLGAVVDHLEARLGESLDVNEAARASGFSRSHFMRLFLAAVGMPMAEYVRRRRLSRAAEDLARGRAVLETAVEWGYGSQAAFTRAFSRVFGVSPAAYARGQRDGSTPVEVLVRYEPRLPFEAGPPPTMTRELRPPLRLVGLAASLAARSRFESFTSVPAIWEDWFARERWRALGAEEPTAPLGLSRLHASGDLEYVIGLPLDPQARVPRGHREVRLPGGAYARFAATGPPHRTMQGLVLAAYGGWFLDPGLRRRPGGWDLETFHPVPGSPAQRGCEFWIPLRP
jgi:AraC family transcriptional regulator